MPREQVCSGLEAVVRQRVIGSYDRRAGGVPAMRGPGTAWGAVMPACNLPIIRPIRSAWNKGRIVGQKRPLLPKHVWAIGVRL